MARQESQTLMKLDSIFFDDGDEGIEELSINKKEDQYLGRVFRSHNSDPDNNIGISSLISNFKRVNDEQESSGRDYFTSFSGNNSDISGLEDLILKIGNRIDSNERSIKPEYRSLIFNMPNKESMRNSIKNGLEEKLISEYSNLLGNSDIHSDEKGSLYMNSLMDFFGDSKYRLGSNSMIRYNQIGENNQIKLSQSKYINTFASGNLIETIYDLGRKGYSIISGTSSKDSQGIGQEHNQLQTAVSLTPQMPAQYADLVATLQKTHPDLQYVGSLSMQDQSQHNVEILSFTYMAEGQRKEFNIVIKDMDEKDEKIPMFLDSLGVPTHLVYDSGRKLVMQHIQGRVLRDIVRNDSEPDMLRACGRALDRIAQIHVAATMNLGLLREFELTLEPTNYEAEFNARFVRPLSNGRIMTLQQDRLSRAYGSFVRSFRPSSFVHGDFHTGNAIINSQQCNVIDYEWAKIGAELDDLSRFTNSVVRDRRGIDGMELARHMITQYKQARQKHNPAYNAPETLHQITPETVLYALINDDLYKAGEYLLFGEAHPKVQQEKAEKSMACFDRAIQLIDDARAMARNALKYSALTELRESLIEYTSASAQQGLKEVVNKYRKEMPYSSRPFVLAA